MSCKVVAAKGGGYDVVDRGTVVDHKDTLDEARASAAIRNDTMGDVQRTELEQPEDGAE